MIKKLYSPSESILVNLYCRAPSSKTFAFFPHCFDGKVVAVAVVSVVGCQVVLGLVVRDIVDRPGVGFGPQPGFELEHRGI